MGVFDKLAFWKHDDLDTPKPDFGKDLGLGSDPGLTKHDDFADKGFAPKDDFTPTGGETAPTSPFDQPFPATRPSPAVPRQTGQAYSQQAQDPMAELKREIDLISSKIDTIRALIDAMNQRIVNIEHIARQEQEETPRKRSLTW